MRQALLLISAVALGNSAIAAFLWMLNFGGDFAHNLLFSQCIGFGIAACCRLAVHLVPPGRALPVAIAASIIAGALLGQAVARQFAGYTVDWVAPITLQSLMVGLVFGGLASTYYYLRERAAALEKELHVREAQRLEAERRSVEAQLKMLQAQIEPHFLFNSLANVAALIESDSRLAARLLDALIRYLRASLARTRADHGTLGDEVALLTAYLEILKIRMGDRLNYRFDVPAEMLTHPFPPMLLQPLVENAVIHGLEPRVEGGTITVRAESGTEVLRITVSDDGLGFSDSPGQGVGLSNVRARLQAHYGHAASLLLSENSPHGISVMMEIPA